MPVSPETVTSGVLRLVLKQDGNAITEKAPPVSVSISRALNTIPSATLVFDDGHMPTGKLPLSDPAWFEPGKKLTILAGYGNKEEQLFQGVVVRHSLSIGASSSAKLTIELRDEAASMTLTRQEENYVDKTDSQVMTQLVSNHSGLKPDITSTSLVHPKLVQFNTSDWDFMLARAEFNGMVVSVVDGTVSVKPPNITASPTLELTWGSDLLSFRSEIDARTQPTKVQAWCWDPKTQALITSNETQPKEMPEQGDLTGKTLAQALGQQIVSLITSASLTREALKLWADSYQLRAGLARRKGSLSFPGTHLAKVGDLIHVKGVGSRFGGNVFVSKVDHEISNGNWTTTVTFGLEQKLHMERPDVTPPPNGGLTPPVHGLQIGVVMKLDGDPENQNRIQVKVPVLKAQTEGIWARLLQFHASNTFGAFFLPEVGDEVLLGYLNDDPAHPVILGSLYSSKQVPPKKIEAANDIKALVTRCKHSLEFDEKNKKITLTTPGNNKVVLDDTDKSILVSDQHGNTLKLSSSGIALDSPKDITLTAKGAIKLTATGAASIEATQDASLKGMNVTCEAKTAMTAKGALCEVSATGQTTVKGAMVMIN